MDLLFKARLPLLEGFWVHSGVVFDVLLDLRLAVSTNGWEFGSSVLEFMLKELMIAIVLVRAHFQNHMLVTVLAQCLVELVVEGMAVFRNIIDLTFHARIVIYVYRIDIL